MASGLSRPDVHADIRDLDCPSGSLREIRLHHVLEHFERAQALALLVRWYEWLQPEGRLMIETPDFETCVEDFGSRGFSEQTAILRHIFGSQEAPWAQHRDGWSASRFDDVLTRLGYAEMKYEHGFSDESGLLANVLVTATKPARAAEREARLVAAAEMLELSMNGRSETEEQLLRRWQRALAQTLGAEEKP